MRHRCARDAADTTYEPAPIGPPIPHSEQARAVSALAHAIPRSQSQAFDTALTWPTRTRLPRTLSYIGRRSPGPHRAATVELETLRFDCEDCLPSAVPRARL